MRAPICRVRFDKAITRNAGRIEIEAIARKIPRRVRRAAFMRLLTRHVVT